MVCYQDFIEQEMMETGLFFGSFNPVHIGHMAIANYIAEYSSLKEIWFVVSPHNPLKTKETLLGDRDRFYMAELAIGDDRAVQGIGR